MDPAVDVIYGPNPLQKTGTVTVPRELLRELGLTPGSDKVHWALNDHVPGTLILIPAIVLARAMPDVLGALRRSSS